MTINYTSNSELIKGEAWSEAIGQAQKNIVPEAIEELESYTPIDTGLLVSQWKVQGENLGINISNETAYAKFQEYGTKYIKPRNMVKNSLPAIIDAYEREIIKELEKR